MSSDVPLVDQLNGLLASVKQAEDAGKAKEARALLEKAPPSMRAFATFHYARGGLLFRAGDVDGALNAFEEACRMEPEVAEFHGNLGAALLSRFQKSQDKADLTRALEVLQRAQSLSPRLASVDNNLGHALLLSGRFVDALQAFDRALSLDSKDIGALFNKAATLHALGKEVECLAALDAVLAIAPDFEPAQKSRANTLKRLGR